MFRPWVVLGALACLARCALAGISPVAGFDDFPWVENLPSTPTSITFAPDGSGRLFVTLKNQGVMVIERDGNRRWFWVTKPYTFSECGVLGLAFDADYKTTGWVYVFVTVSPSEQRIYRMRDLFGRLEDKGRAVEVVNFVRGLPTRGRNHDGGALAFGPDGRLYFTVGDLGAQAGAYLDVRSMAAKVGRVNRDRSVPLDNPFVGVRGANPMIWAAGFRNPFSMVFQPGVGALWLNVVGTDYEQIFEVTRNSHGGWKAYEGNQGSASRGTYGDRTLLVPRLQYRTDYSGSGQERAITDIGRDNNKLYVTFAQAHAFRVGQIVTLTGTAFDGEYPVLEVLSGNRLTLDSPGAGTRGTVAGGTVKPLENNGCVLGGSFYESTAFPPEFRTGYYFADYVGGKVWYARLNSSNQPTGITKMLQGSRQPTDTATGWDGALYYSSGFGNAIRRLAYTQPSGLIVTQTNVRTLEEGQMAFSVKLAQAPAASVPITVTRTGGDAVVQIVYGSALSVSPQNWEAPQTVYLHAAADADTEDDAAEFTVSAPGMAPIVVHATVKDTTQEAPVLSTQALTVPERGTGTFTIALPEAPSRPVTVRVRRVEGSTAPRIVQGASLRFTPENWNQPRTVKVLMRPDKNTTSDVTTFEVSGTRLFRRLITVTGSEAPAN